MDPNTFAWTARLHGHLAVLALALLLHPVFGLRRRVTPGARLSSALAGGAAAASWLLGAWLYPAWRREVKPGWVVAQHPVVPAFEVKEHLAAVAAVLAVSAALALRSGGEAARPTARALFALAFLAAAVTAALGVGAAGVLHPAW